MKPLKFIKSLFCRYHLVHIMLNGIHANTYIAGSLGRFVAQQQKKGRNIVVVNAWPITSAEYFDLKDGKP